MANPPAHLTITVGPDGTVSTDFLNFTGSACLDTGRQLHALLAELGIEMEVTQFTPKPELSGAPAFIVVSQEQVLPEGEG
jgi:hypothetical protein